MNSFNSLPLASYPGRTSSSKLADSQIDNENHVFLKI